MWPLIVRELRVAARRWPNYWLRVTSACAVTVAIFLSITSLRIGQGMEAFGKMHMVVIGAIWVIVPLMACDCLSSERREGTLGLLFLTTLKSRHIVLAKATAHAIRAFSLWLATVPLISLPLLLGGVTWAEIAVSAAISFSCICFALAAAIFASAFATRINGAVALVMLGIIPALIGQLAVLSLSLDILRSMFAPAIGNSFLQTVGLLFPMEWDFSTPSGKQLFGCMLALAPLSLLPLALIVLLSGLVLRQRWQERPKSTRQLEVERKLFQPRFGKDFFRRWMRRTLDRNPIGWLEMRSWTGRIAAMVWLAIMISFASAIAGNAQLWRGERNLIDNVMHLLLISMAYVASASFRRERETGAMELIMVTPLTTRHILLGRLRGLWLQFLPAAAVWLFVRCYLGTIIQGNQLTGFGYGEDAWSFWAVLNCVAAYAALPAVGLFFSLRCSNALVAWAATWASWYLVPRFVVEISQWLSRAALDLDLIEFPSTLRFLLQVIIAAIASWRLYGHLSRRSFSLRTA